MDCLQNRILNGFKYIHELIKYICPVGGPKGKKGKAVVTAKLWVGVNAV